MDAEDGSADRAWMGHDVLDRRTNWRERPVWDIYQPTVLESVIEQGGYGQDDVPDLLFTNCKHIDAIGHRWSMDSREMRATIGHSDAALRELTGYLD